MKIAKEYAFPKLFLRCFGEEKYLNQIDNLFDISDISGTPVDIWKVLEIIIVNQILSFAKGRTIAGKIDSINFNLFFKKYNLLINEDEFNEYMFYTSPTEIAKLIGFSKEEELSILYDIKKKRNLP